MDELSRWSRVLIALVIALAVATALYPFTAKPVTWDELVYMGLAFRPEPRAWRLHRYAHVYALLPFVRLAGDPYVGARLFWSCSVGLTTGMLVWTSLLEPAPIRWLVLGLTMLFFAGQEDLFAYPGIAYDEYTAMAALTATFCLAWTRLARGRPISGRDAAVMGLLMLIAIKATELAVPALILVALLFISPSGRVRFDQRALQLGARWVGGMMVGSALIMGLDGFFLGDALFSLRPSSWLGVLRYDFPAVPTPAPTYVPFAWLHRPEFLRSLLPYVAGGLVWVTIERDARLRLLYALPLALPAALLLLEALGRLDFAPRYMVPVIPILCFLPAVALSRLAKRGYPERLLRGRLLRSVAMLVLPALVAAALLPVWRVVAALTSRTVQHEGERRFAGFYEVARAAHVEPDAVIYVSERLYDGAIRGGILPALTRMNFNLPLSPSQLVRGVPLGSNADYAVLNFAEYQAWRTAHGADPPDVIVSADQRVVLLCLRAACPRVRGAAF